MTEQPVGGSLTALVFFEIDAELAAARRALYVASMASTVAAVLLEKGECVIRLPDGAVQVYAAPPATKIASYAREIAEKMALLRDFQLNIDNKLTIQ